MPSVERRVFFAKVGMSDALVEHLKAGFGILEDAGHHLEARMLTDQSSGRSDRVVMETSFENPGEIEETIQSAISDASLAAKFAQWLEDLNGMIHYSETENWSVR